MASRGLLNEGHKPSLHQKRRTQSPLVPRLVIDKSASCEHVPRVPASPARTTTLNAISSATSVTIVGSTIDLAREPRGMVKIGDWLRYVW
jgi:hypothetical protein